MGSILYLALGVLFGYAVCETVFPGLKTCGTKTFCGKELSLSSYLIRIPAWVLAGVIPLTWVTYLAAYVIKTVFGTEYPLGAANVFSMVFFCDPPSVWMDVLVEKCADYVIILCK